jgi:hypothetical protein
MFWIHRALFFRDMFHFVAAIAMLFHPPAPDFRANLGFWQRTLDLQDWRVSVQLVPIGELDENTVGDIDIKDRDKTATIRILREQDSEMPRRLARADQQLTLVHELVHLRRMVDGEAWHNEAATITQTTELVRFLRRKREAAAIEGL